jgi:hypothetical protein
MSSHLRLGLSFVFPYQHFVQALLYLHGSCVLKDSERAKSHRENIISPLELMEMYEIRNKHIERIFAIT